jgi:hypothetical protein
MALINTTTTGVLGSTFYADGSGDLTIQQNGALVNKITSNGLTYRGTGSVLQVVNTQSGAVATGTTAIQIDDTIPQNTEGTEFMTLAITPTNINNKLVVQVVMQLSTNADANIGIALFQDSTANALAAQTFRQDVSTGFTILNLIHYMTAGTTSSTTFKARGGAGSGTYTFNGTGGGRIFGGVMSSSITIMEIAA